MAYAIPSQMKAIRYNHIRDFELVKIPVPEPIMFFALTARPCCPTLSSITNLADRVSGQIIRNLRNRLTYP